VIPRPPTRLTCRHIARGGEQLNQPASGEPARIASGRSYPSAVKSQSSRELKGVQGEPKGRSASGPSSILGFVVDHPVCVQDVAVDDAASTAGSTGSGHPPGKSEPRRARALAHARIPPFNNAVVPSAQEGIVLKSRTLLIGGSDARHTGKRPGQRSDGRPDTHHDSPQTLGLFLPRSSADHLQAVTTSRVSAGPLTPAGFLVVSLAVRDWCLPLRHRRGRR
jgi:hypothetical protein